jgi:hypothetical protein
MEIKKHENPGISKRQLSDITGVNHNSIVKWCKINNEFGITYKCKIPACTGIRLFLWE